MYAIRSYYVEREKNFDEAESILKKILVFDDRQTSVALGLLLLAAFWAIGLSRRWMWASYLGLFLCTGAAAVGLWYDLSFGWLLAGVVGALLTYDLGDFNHRLRFAASTDNVQLMERAHLYRLGIRNNFV